MESDQQSETITFNALLYPHRSLEKRHFARLMTVVALILLIISLIFYSIGAWPIVGFLGLDLLLFYWAFRINYRDAKAYEQIIITEKSVQIIKTDPKGNSQSHGFNPYWVRLSTTWLEDEGMTKLSLTSHGETVEIGSFLHAPDRESLANALSGAIADCKAGRNMQGNSTESQESGG